jgi:putative photosynthetic complex assembly protein
MTYLHIEEEEGANVSVPTPALVVALLLAVSTIGLAGYARHTRAIPAPPPRAPGAVRALVLSDRPDGGVGVYDARAHEQLAPLPAGGGGFVRGAIRGLARQRRLDRVGPDVPFYLARWPDGRLTLDDSATGSHLDLRAFGPDNAAAFARLLPAR